MGLEQPHTPSSYHGPLSRRFLGVVDQSGRVPQYPVNHAPQARQLELGARVDLRKIGGRDLVTDYPEDTYPSVGRIKRYG